MANKIKFDLKKVKRMASRGLNQSQIAIALGCSASTVEERLRNDKDFKDAYELGKASGLDDIANSVYDEAIAGNMVAAKFYLAARHGWSDKLDLTSGGNALAPVVINVINDATDD
jgi:predicted transcriptional regulator